MNVLVIGGTRYFGKVIVRKLLARGDSVTIYTRGQSRPEFWDDVERIEGDRTDYDDFAGKLRGRSFDAVIDNVAYKVEDARAAVRALKGATAKYLFTSTVSVYGGPGHAIKWRTVSDKDRPSRLDHFVDLQTCCPLREDDLDLAGVPWDYDPQLSPYAQGKRQIERYLRETPDFLSVVLRVPATVGPEDPSLRFWWYMQRILDGGEIILRDGGSNIFRNGFRDDIAQAFLDALDSPNTTNQVYNICQAEVTTLRRFLEVLAEEAGRRLNAVAVPGDVAERLSKPPWHDWSFDPFSRPPAYVMSIEKARRDFGLHSTPMSEWVKQTVEWYNRHHDGADSAHYERRSDEVAFARWWSKRYGEFVSSLVPPG